MFSSKPFLSLLLIAISLRSSSSVTANQTPRNSQGTLKFARRLNMTGFLNIANADRAHVKAFKSLLSGKPGGQEKRASTFSATNDGAIYTASVGIGSPATEYNLVIDTGSPITWVGANSAHPYIRTSTSKSTGQSLSISYTKASFSGSTYTDRVTLSPELVITSQTIGAASTSTGVDPADGILGLGPVGLTTFYSPTKIPTVTDNLFTQRTISTESIGVYFAPFTDPSGSDGELSFGGADSSKFTGNIGYVPITSSNPSSRYWGIDMSVSYGSTSIMGSTAGIVDTGTSFVLLPNSAYLAYVQATGATYDSTTTMLTISASQYNALKNLDFNIGTHTYSLTPNGQIWPRSLNSLFGGNSDSIYLAITTTGTDFGGGLDFIMGFAFLERFYSVYDTTNGRIGFATTTQTTSTSN